MNGTTFRRRPTCADRMNPRYRYLSCESQWCCANIDQGIIANWIRAGVPERWHYAIRDWVWAGLTPEQVLPYVPTDGSTHDHVPPHIAEFVRAGLTGQMKNGYVAAGIFDGTEMLDLHRRDCTPEDLIAYLLPQITEDNATYMGHRFTSLYLDAVTAADNDPALPLALMRRNVRMDDVKALATTWAASHRTHRLPVDQVLRLHAAGYTPTDLDTNPDLADADPDTLAAVTALRGTATADAP